MTPNDIELEVGPCNGKPQRPVIAFFGGKKHQDQLNTGSAVSRQRFFERLFDRFHVIKLYNEKLSDLRRDLYRELTDMMQKDALKGVRWLLLKRQLGRRCRRRLGIPSGYQLHNVCL